MSDLGYDGFAYLRGGPHAAVISTLAVMYVNGWVEAWRPGMVSARDVSPTLHTPMEHAAWSSLYQAARPRTLATRPPMRRALNTSRVELIRAGALRPPWLWVIQRLLGVALVALATADLIAGSGLAGAAATAAVGVAAWFMPRRTIAGHRALVAARHRHPIPISDDRTQPSQDAVGMAVALYGDAALLALMARFAIDGGLLDRRTSNDETGDAPAPPSNPATWGY